MGMKFITSVRKKGLLFANMCLRDQRNLRS